MGDEQCVDKTMENGENGVPSFKDGSAVDLQKLLSSPEVLKTAEVLGRASQPDVIAVNEYIASLPADFSEISKRKLFLPLDECTIPFYVVDLEERERKRRENHEKQEEIKLLPALDHIITNERTRNIAILGEPGDGKTVLMLKLAEEYATKYGALGKIPIYIDLSHYHGQGLIQLILENIKFLEGLKADRDEMLRQGRFVFLLDGLDEAGKGYDELARELSSIPSELASNRFIVSSRKNEYRALHSFKEFELQEVTLAQIREFLDKDKKYKGLLDKLMEEPGMNLWENRLLLSFLIQLYESDIHEGREFSYKNEADLYERMINLFMQREEEKQGDKYVISRAVNIKLLSEIAYEMQAINKTSRLSKKGVEEVIERVLSNDSAEFRARVYDLIRENGLISYDKNSDSFSFIHKTLQEYLCARAIKDRLEGKIVDKDEKQRVTTVREAWERLFSYEIEYKDLLGVEDRALLPAWQATMLFLAGMVNESKAQELVDVVGEGYDRTRYKPWFMERKRYYPFAKHLFNKEHNPFYSQHLFMFRLGNRNDSLRNSLGQKIILQLAEEGSNSDVDKHELLEYITELKYYDSALIRLLTDEDGAIAYAAKRALEVLRHFDLALLELLLHEEGQVRRSAVDVLGETGHYDDKLVQLLEDDHLQVRESAVRALIKIGHYDPRLLELLNHRESYVVAHAIEVLGGIRHYDPCVLDLISNKEHLGRNRLAEALGNMGHYDSRILALLEDEDKWVRYYAVTAIGEIGYYDSEVIQKLVGLGRGRHNMTRGAVATALGKLGHYHPILLELLDDQGIEGHGVQKESAEALGKLRHYDPKLLGLLEHRVPWVKEAAVEALGEIGYTEDNLEELIESEEDKIDYKIARTLGSRGYFDDRLIALTKSRHIIVRYAAREAIKKIRFYDPKLVSLSKDETFTARNEVCDALRQMGYFASGIVDDIFRDSNELFTGKLRSMMDFYNLPYNTKIGELLLGNGSIGDMCITKALAENGDKGTSLVDLLDSQKDSVRFNAALALRAIGSSKEIGYQIIQAVRERPHLRDREDVRKLVASIYPYLKPTGYGEPLKNAA